MTRLESLKAEHPGFCFNCGHWVKGSHVCFRHTAIAALVAALEEAEEAWVNERQERLEVAEEVAEEMLGWGDEVSALRTRLAATERLLEAEQTAHAETRKALEEADRALITCWGRTEPDKLRASNPAYRAARARSAQRKGAEGGVG